MIRSENPFLMNTLQFHKAALDLDGIELEFNNLIIILNSNIGGQIINIIGSYLKMNNIEIIFDFAEESFVNKAGTIISLIYASDYEPPYSRMEFINITLINKMTSIIKYPVFIIGTYNDILCQEFYFLNEVINSSLIDNRIFQLHSSNFSLINGNFR